MNKIRLGSIALVCLCLSVASADDWLRFRGPGGSGVSTESTRLPTEWSPTANVGFKTALPGAGVSSPIAVGTRVFVTCYSGYGLRRESPGDINDLKRHLVCIDGKSGAVIWQQEVAAAMPEDPYTGIGVTGHGYASHTPVSDGSRVYVFYGKSGVYAYDFDGNQLWHADVGKESDPWKWGSSSSPIVHNDVLVVTASAESQALVGLDKNTGNEVWRQEAKGLDGMWGTPILVDVAGGGVDLVMIVANEIWGLNPVTGKLRWWCSTFDAEHAYSSAVCHDATIYAVTSGGGGSIAVSAGGKGDVTETNVRWVGKDTVRFGSPIVYGPNVYLVGNDVMKAIDRQTGEIVKQLRLKSGRREGGGRSRTRDYGSPVAAADRLFYLKGNGEMIVISTGDQIEQLNVNRITSSNEQFGGTPAIAGGRIYFRSDKHLYCVVDKGEEVQPDEIVAIAPEAEEEDDDAAPRRRQRDRPVSVKRQDTRPERPQRPEAEG